MAGMNMLQQNTLDIKEQLAGAVGEGAAIEMHKIVKTFKTSAGDFSALRGVDMNFLPGEFVGVTGKSGSGKSTLANMLTGIDRPTSGEIKVGDVYIHNMGESQMARWRGKNLGIVFQFYQLLPMLSLVENVMLPMDFANCYPSAQREKRALELLDMVGLADLANKMPAAVSGGQQQAAAIARALANDPQYLIADEPTGNLDSRTADQIFELFLQLSQQGKTVIMVTHDPNLADRMSRQVVISDGEIINEWVRRTFPMLSHPQMLKLTHNLESMHYEPGQTIIEEGAVGEALYILTRGQVEVAVKDQRGQDKVVTRLSAGEYFGEVELLEENWAIATVRTALETPVELVALRRATIMELIHEVKGLYEAISRVVTFRRQENDAARSES
jgi:ABC-type lipoprotein export system ATPase subunit